MPFSSLSDIESLDNVDNLISNHPKTTSLGHVMLFQALKLEFCDSLLLYFIGQRGSLLYRLSEDQCLDDHGPEYQCRVWAVNQENIAGLISFLAATAGSCPCTLQQALLDPSFMYTMQELCFVSRSSPAQASTLCSSR